MKKRPYSGDDSSDSSGASSDERAQKKMATPSVLGEKSGLECSPDDLLLLCTELEARRAHSEQQLAKMEQEKHEELAKAAERQREELAEAKCGGSSLSCEPSRRTRRPSLLPLHGKGKSFYRWLCLFQCALSLFGLLNGCVYLVT